MTFVNKAVVHHGLCIDGTKAVYSAYDYNERIVYKISFHRSKYADFLMFMEEVRAFYGKNVEFCGMNEPADFMGDENGWIIVYVQVIENVFSSSREFIR